MRSGYKFDGYCRGFLFHAMLTLIIFLMCLPAYANVTSSRFTVLEDFELGAVNLGSWADQDISPNSWILDTAISDESSMYSLKLYGNCWKQEQINPVVISQGSVFQASMYFSGNANIQGIGFSDGTNALFYSVDGTATLDIEEWIPVYQGSKNSNTWNQYRFPIADDWFAFYDYLPIITSIIYVNDTDTSSGTIWFDSIRDISSDIPISPQVSISTTITRDDHSDIHREVGIQFTSTVIDPDSQTFSYYWSFGDSLTSLEANPFHLYSVTDDHPYRVSLVVTDESGRTGFASTTVNIDTGETSLPLTMNFVGDIMLARRYEQGGGIIPTQGVNAIFQPTKQFLGDAADLTIANLEVVLTNQGTPHPTKSVCYRGAPGNVSGLSYAGIDAVSLANNHVIDYGLEGLQQMRGNLASAGIVYSGAGANSYEAYQPGWLNKKGLNIALLRSSDRTGQYNHAEPYLNAGYNKYGFAYMTPYYVTQQIDSVSPFADLIIAELHGGSEYSLSPGSGYDKSPLNLEEDTNQDEDYGYLTDIPHQWDIELRHTVVDAGADLVIVHHPHILHGLEYYNGVLIAHSLGNFVFDLDYPETMPSAILYADAYPDGFKNFSLKPVFIDQYIPKPATGQLATYILDYIAARSRELNTVFVVDKQANIGNVMEHPADYTEQVSHYSYQLWPEPVGTGIYATKPTKLPRAGSISAIEQVTPVQTPELRLGVETIWYGNFESEGSTLWDIPAFSSDAFDGARSALLNPSNGQTTTATISKKCKWYDNTKKYTLHGWMKCRNASAVNIIIRYYSSRTGGVISTESVSTGITGSSDWQWFYKELTLPNNAYYYDIRLTATGAGVNASALFDNVGLIEWTNWQTADSYQTIPYPNNYYWMQIRSSELPKSLNVSFTETDFLPVENRKQVTSKQSEFTVRALPNPMSSGGKFFFTVPEAKSTTIKIYNLRGQLVKTLAEALLEKGEHTLSWDGKDETDLLCTSGIYFVKVSQGGRSGIAKFVFIK